MKGFAARRSGTAKRDISNNKWKNDLAHCPVCSSRPAAGGGRTRVFLAPSAEDWVLYIHR